MRSLKVLEVQRAIAEGAGRVDTLTDSDQELEYLQRLGKMKVALVHEWYATYAGSERVVEQILKLFPQADLFALVDHLDEKDRHFLAQKKVNTSFIQKLPFSRRAFRQYLPFMPLAIEQFDLSAYDIVVSSSHAVAKGVITGPEQFHISYVHSPMRYAWDLQHQYLRESGMSSGIKSMFTRWILHYLRMWDTRTVHGVDSFLANSAYIARRIEKVYGRKARVVYPPVDTTKFTLDAERKKEPFYLAASRMVAYKCMPLIVEAFSKMPDRSLVVIGDGPDMPRVRALAAGKSNIRVLGYQPDEVLLEHMQRAQAFVFAAKEDFGIAPVEAQACGTPVIAYAAGGALETVAGHAGHPGRTGVYFYEQTELAIRQAVDEFKSLSDSAAIDAAVCRRNAERYSEAKFCINFLDAVVEGLDQCANSAR